MAAITIPATLESLRPCLAFVTACATEAGFTPKRVAEIELAVEEALANICQYAYLDTAGEVEIRCIPDHEQQFLIEFIDAGEPFNVLTLPAPDLTADVDQRSTGGLGVFLIRTLVDKVTYRREGKHNILQLMMQGPQTGKEELL